MTDTPTSPARLLLIPLDDRPATARYPAQIGAVAGCEVLVPPLALQGNLTKPADSRRLMDWLEQEAPHASGLVIALDTLAYGGLIASRQSREPSPKIIERLIGLWQLRERFPALSLSAFATIARLSETAAPEEEAPYWPEYGTRLVEISRLTHLAQRSPGPEQRVALQRAEATVPETVLADFRAWRSRNFEVNRLMVEWAAAGLFDHFYLTVDDSADVGINVMEKEALQTLVNERGLGDKVLIYPGADEVACSLVARTLLQRADFRPLFFPIYSEPDGEQAVTMYEGIPLGDTLALQLAAAGAGLAGSPEKADCQLFVHGPALRGGDFWLGIDLPESREAIPETFARDIQIALQLDAPVAIADVAWANAAHPAFAQRLADGGSATKLLGFAGWNTAGNTLGTVIAHASARLLSLDVGGDLAAQEQAHQRFLFERFAEDWLYMGIERPAAAARPGPVDFDDLARQVKVRVEGTYARYWQGQPLCRVEPDGTPHYWRLGGIQIQPPTFPWGRLFDIDLTGDIHLEEVP